MKKNILIAFAILFGAMYSSCTKENTVKPSVKSSIDFAQSSGTGSADGTPPAITETPNP